MEKFLEQQEKILQQQQEILATLNAVDGKISALNDNTELKNSLDAVGELLKLTAANQVMNLVGK